MKPVKNTYELPEFSDEYNVKDLRKIQTFNLVELPPPELNARFAYRNLSELGFSESSQHRIQEKTKRHSNFPIQFLGLLSQSLKIQFWLVRYDELLEPHGTDYNWVKSHNLTNHYDHLKNFEFFGLDGFIKVPRVIRNQDFSVLNAQDLDDLKSKLQEMAQAVGFEHYALDLNGSLCWVR